MTGKFKLITSVFAKLLRHRLDFDQAAALPARSVLRPWSVHSTPIITQVPLSITIVIVYAVVYGSHPLQTLPAR
ncbi:MAG: hypothetical protein O2971_05145 [Proteobacteria bacterium]|nr:hypothetical protein [Pseudomonadota bacterium]